MPDDISPPHSSTPHAPLQPDAAAACPPAEAERLAALEAEVALLREQHAAMLASTSWRLTAPLRTLRRVAASQHAAMLAATSQRLAAAHRVLRHVATRLSAVPRLPSADVLRRRLHDAPLIGPRLVRRALERRYHGWHGVTPQLDPPRSFNEHVIARILRDRDPRLKIICDKVAMRDVVRAALGPEALVPLLGVWDDPAEVPWDSLPLPFVIKPNHASGLVHFVRTAEDVRPATLTAMARSWLALDYYDSTFEWGYRGIRPRLIVEPVLRGPDGAAPVEAQVYTFGGRGHLLRVTTGLKKTPERRESWFDTDGTQQPIRFLRYSTGTYVLDREMAHRLVAMAEAVATGFVHLRVDFYLTDRGLRIGELTPYTIAGAADWSPRDVDLQLGALWTEAAARQARG